MQSCWGVSVSSGSWVALSVQCQSSWWMAVCCLVFHGVSCRQQAPAQGARPPGGLLYILDQHSMHILADRLVCGTAG